MTAGLLIAYDLAEKSHLPPRVTYKPCPPERRQASPYRWVFFQTYGHVAVDVVLTLTDGYNAVRGHRTVANNSGAEDYLRRKTSQKPKVIHTITETSRIPQTKLKR